MIQGKSRLLAYLLQSLALALLYFAAARIGLLLALPDAEQVTPVWPPTGMSLAALLLLGYRVWPGVALGAFATNFLVTDHVLTACGIAVGNTLEALAGAWLLRRVAGPRPSLERLRDVIGLIALSTCLSTTISATIGATSLCLGGEYAWNGWLRVWTAWWVGDAMGALLVASFLIAWLTRPRFRLGSRRYPEAALNLALLIIVSRLVFFSRGAEFFQEHSAEYLVFPLITWAALRLGQRGTTLVNLVASFIAIIGTAKGLGPFAQGNAYENLQYLLAFLGVTSTTGLLLAAATSERNTGEERRGAVSAVAGVLDGVSSAEEAWPKALSAICRRLGWSCGIAWTVDREKGVLRAAAVYHDAAFPPLVAERLRGRTVSPGQGLAGSVWASAAPGWSAQVEADFEPSKSSQGRAMAAEAFAFPILWGSEVQAILEFYASSSLEPDEGQLRMAGTIGRQIGLLLERKRAEDSLRRGEERYRSLVLASSQVVWTTAANGEVVEDLPTWREFTGQKKEEMLGYGWMAMVHPDDRTATAETWSRSLAGGQPHEDEFRVRRSDGVYRRMLARAMPVLAPDGTVREWVGTCTDITEKKLAEQERSRLLARERAARADAETAQKRAAFLAEVSSLLSASLDSEANLQAVARQAIPEIGECCAMQLMQPDGSLQLIALAHADPGRQELARELAMRYPLGIDSGYGPPQVIRGGEARLYPVITDEHLQKEARDPAHLKALRELAPRSVIIAPLEAHGRVLGAITFIAAGSPRSFTAEDVALAEDVARRTALAVDNARLYQEASEASRLKDEFLAMLAHELRNPLSPILNAVEIMRQSGTAEDTLQWAQEVVERQVQNMARLLDDLLDVSRITRGKIELRKCRVDLAEVLQCAIENNRQLLDQRGHSLNVALVEQPLWVDADPLRLEQVFTNLLNNAAKYTDEPGQISIRAERQGEEGVVEVKDTGRGMPADLLPYVFELFVQSRQPLDRTQGGLGIGLTVVRSLVEMHGGTVRASSPGIDQGSTFTIRLPIHSALSAKPEPSSVGPAGRAAVDQRSLRILVVDDQVDVAITMAVLLRTFGHNVQVAHDGPTALSEAASFLPEVVFLDIGLPGMDGYQVVQQMRRESYLAKTIFVAISGYGQESDRRRSRDAGFNVHLLKPIEIEKLYEVLASDQRAGEPQPEG